MQSDNKHTCQGYRAPNIDRRLIVVRALSLLAIQSLPRLGRANVTSKPQNGSRLMRP